MSITTLDIDTTPLIITNELRLRWLKSSIAWVEDVVKPRLISEQQRDVLRGYDRLVWAKMHRKALTDGIPNTPPLTEEEERLCKLFGISIQSGKGTGKNAVGAWVMLHFMDCMQTPNIKIMCTAPTEEQLKNNLWAEINKWIIGSPYLKDVFSHSSEKVYRKEFLGKAVFATWKTCARSADPNDQAATMAGKHEDYMILFADEASAIPDPVFRPIESTMTGPVNFAVITFNPTRSKGYAIQTQTIDRMNWMCFQWDAEQSEVVDPMHIERYAKKYGRNSNMYRINIRGLPPKSDMDVLIPYDWVDRAIDADIDIDPEEDMVVGGLDVAGGGSDSTVLVYGAGGRVEGIIKNDFLRTSDIAYWVMDQWNLLGLQGLAVDANGLGLGVCDSIEILDKSGATNIRRVNVSCEAEDDPQRFEGLRDELWWLAHNAFMDFKVSIPNHEELIGELTSIKYDLYRGKGGKIKVESKKEMRTRGLKSPDCADAFCLWLYMRKWAARRMKRSIFRNARLHNAGRATSWRTV